MAGFSNYFNSSGYTSSSGAPSPITTATNKSGSRQNLYTKSYAIVDPAVDEKWGAFFSGDPTDNTYYDYYYGGSDFKVYIDGADSFNLPVAAIQWTITQEKEFIYGYNSYTYDAVARGRRLVQGAFSIYFVSPQYLMQAISLSAQTRANNKGALIDQYYRGLTDDDANIQQYWSNNLDPSLANEGMNLFSSSPPFSFVILYGLQDVSTTAVDTASYWQNFGSDDTLLFDTNQRLVAPNTVHQKMVIDDVELTQMTVAIDPSGKPVQEVYQFTARDYYIPNIQS